jgi:hypothetical protein
MVDGIRSNFILPGLRPALGRGKIVALGVPMKQLRCVGVCLLLAAGVLSASDFGRGTKITVRISTTVSSERSTFGDPVDAVLMDDVVVKGKVIATRGASAHGVVSSATPSTRGKITTPGNVAIRLETIEGTDGTYHLSTNQYTREGREGSHSPLGTGSTGGISIDSVGGVRPQSPVPTMDPNGVTLSGGGPEAIIPAESIISFRAAAISAPVPKK